MLAMLAARGRLDPAVVPFAGLDAYKRLSDKAIVVTAAPNSSIAVPNQTVLRSSTETGQLEDVVYPAVIKPSSPVIGAGSERRQMGAFHVSSEDELRSRLRETPADAYPLLVQQRIVGPGVGIFLLEWDEELVASFAHRRIREKPPAGGVSVYRESIRADPELISRSRRLLKDFGWEGVAMVEYKIEARTGTPYLMEVNCRFWGSLQLAIDAGVDFPRLLVGTALGNQPEPVHDYRTGIRSRWWWGDIDHILARLRYSSEDLALPPGAPARSMALLQFLIPWRPGDRSEVFRVDDPKPFIRETMNWFQGE